MLSHGGSHISNLCHVTYKLMENFEKTFQEYCMYLIFPYEIVTF